MFGRDAILPLNKLLQPQVQYLGNDENILSMQALKNIYEVVAQNLKTACAKITDISLIPTKLKEGDLVLIKDHTAKAFQPRYVGNYRIVSFKGNQVEVHKTEGGNTTWVHLTDIKYILPVDNIITKLPDYHSFGRKTKLRLNLDRIPNQHWNLSTTLNTTPTLTTQQSLMQTSMVSIWLFTKKFKIKIIKKRRNNIFKIRFIKTHELELNISFSIRKEVIKYYLKHLTGITKMMTLWESHYQNI